ncbi:hypothetical protein FRC07_010779, partial [Ceratobasidium sp. 392]
MIGIIDYEEVSKQPCKYNFKLTVYHACLEAWYEAWTKANGGDQSTAPCEQTCSTHTENRDLTEVERPNPVAMALTPATASTPATFPPPPNPHYIPSPVNAINSLGTTAYQSSLPPEGELGTYQTPWTYDAYPLLPIVPPPILNPYFPSISPRLATNPYLSPNDLFDGGYGPITLDQLHRNPWVGEHERVCHDARGGVGKDDAQEINLGQHESATQTKSTSAAYDSGITSANIQNFLHAEKSHIQRVSKGRVIYQHPTAGRSYGKGRTRWQAEREKNDKERGGNPYGMWASKDEWETVKWMATEKVSQSSLDKLLKTERYKDAKYSFKNAKSLFRKIKHEMAEFGGPEWNVEDIALTDAPQDKSALFFKDIQECADFQFGQARFAGKMSFAPEKHYNAEETERLFGNPWTADDWGETQARNIAAWHNMGRIAVCKRLDNLEHALRRRRSPRVAYIPKSKFENAMAALKGRPKAVRQKVLGLLNRRLFHRCMTIITRPLRRKTPHDVIDPEGNIRSVLYELSGYIADLEEQWLVAGLGGSTCPHCTCDGAHLGDVESGLPRTRADVLKTLKKIKEDYRKAWGRSPSLEEYLNLAGEKHLNGVNKPFWKSIPGLDIFHILSPDLLHGFHKFFYDHIYRFNCTGMGLDEYDARIRLQPQFSGDRAFLHGVSHISQMTGIEHRLLERTHLPIVANAPGVINAKVTRATSGVMECIYLAQLPVHSDRTLQAYESAYENFMANRQAWIDNGTRRGKKVVIPHFNIPKMHVIRHHTHHVRRKGSAVNYTTETMEHLHIGLKEA